MNCPSCGELMTVVNGRYTCSECGWVCAVDPAVLAEALLSFVPGTTL